MAEKLDSHNSGHIYKAADLIAEGKVVVFPFEGIFGIFTRIDKPDSAQRIMEIKERPLEKGLVAVTPPELLDGNTDFKKLFYPIDSIRSLLTSIHALGVIMPASKLAPPHLIKVNPQMALNTLLTIWTESTPLRALCERLKLLGINGLAGTSANKSGESTHFNSNAVWKDFHTQVDAVVTADFSYLEAIRRQSTSIVDLTYRHPSEGYYMPRLHRLGNTTTDEIGLALAKNGLPALFNDGFSTIFVEPREDSANDSKDVDLSA